MISNTYEPFLIEADPQDTEYEEYTLTLVDPHAGGKVWNVTRDTGWSLSVPLLEERNYGGGEVLWSSPEPKVGDRLRYYGSRGRPIRGITLNGAVVFYRTIEMQAMNHRRWVEDLNAQNARRLVIDRPKMDANYEALIPEFKTRIDGFRVRDENFRRDSEAYEVFCLLEAQKIAEYCRQNSGAEVIDAYRKSEFGFYRLWDGLREAGVVSDEHTNNTFGAAVMMAEALLKEENA